MPHTNRRQAAAQRTGDADRSKGKGKAKRPTEATFDDLARTEYLTGFSKRKKARSEAAKVRADKRAREERRELRKQLRETRKSQAQDNVKQQAEYYGTDAFAPDESGSDDGFDSTEELGKEYRSGDRRTVVTVEDMSLDPSPPSPPATTSAPPLRARGADRPAPRGKEVKEQPKWMTAVKKKRIPYESRATRTIERAKKASRRAAKKEGKKKR